MINKYLIWGFTMLFSSNVFLFVFLPISVIGYYLIGKRLRNFWLFAVSIFFYAWGEPKFVFVLLASIALNYLIALLISRAERPGTRKALLITAIATNIGLLFVYKYAGFTIKTINGALHSSLPAWDIVMPIGISFFTFQALSYVIDVYRGTSGAQTNPLNVGLYIALFPQLIAGPIVRYNSIAEQISNRKHSLTGVLEGTNRFAVGLCKKVLLANNLAVVADKAFSLNAAGSELGAAMAWLGALAYALQIYFDFSGYSDMAIGLAQMFGFRLDENFNYPYIAKSITDFWRRWHISLSTWFRDYVYFPLGGSRVSNKMLIVRNLFVVWLLTGIWHGANWTFALWGLLYFIFLCIERFLIHPAELNKTAAAFYRAATLLLVLLCWVFFRSDSIGDAAKYIVHMFSFGKIASDGKFFVYLREYWVFMTAGLVFSCPVIPWLAKLTESHRRVGGVLKIAGAFTLTVLFFLSVCSLVEGAYNPFIYFNF